MLRRLSTLLLALLAFAIPVEYKYDKLFRFFSLKLIPAGIELPSFFDKKIYFYVSDLIVLVIGALALFAFRIPLRRLFLYRGAPFLWVVFFLSIVSILLSPFAQYPIPYVRLLQLLTPILLFTFLANALPSEEKSKITNLLFGTLVIAALFQSAVAILQYFQQAPLGLHLLSEPKIFSPFHVPDGKRWIFDAVFHRVANTTALLRATGTLPHANVLGGFLCCSLLASYSLFFLPRWRLLIAFSLPFQFFAMCLSFSRSALFAWALGSLVWFGCRIASSGCRATLSDRGVRLLSLAIFASAATSAVLLHEQFLHRGGVVNYNGFVKGSDAARIYYQNVALAIIKDHPFCGVGFHQLSVKALDYVPADGSPYDTASGTHNIYLYLAAETGLFSLAAFFLFIGTLLKAAARTPFTPQIGSLFAIFIAFLFIGCCDFYPLLFQQGKLLFFLFAGLLAAQSSQRSAPALEKRAGAQ